MALTNTIRDKVYLIIDEKTSVPFSFESTLPSNLDQVEMKKIHNEAILEIEEKVKWNIKNKGCDTALCESEFEKIHQQCEANLKTKVKTFVDLSDLTEDEKNNAKNSIKGKSAVKSIDLNQAKKELNKK